MFSAMDQFTVVLPSNDSCSPSNTIADYNITLPRSIILEGNWNVGVQGVSYTKSWFNVVKKSKIYLVNDDGGKFVSPKYVNAGYYPNEESVLEAINRAMYDMDIFFPRMTVKFPKISFDKITRTVSVESGHTVAHQLYLEMEDELTQLLGLKYTYSKEYYEISNSENVVIQQNRIKGEANSFRHYDLHGGIRSIFLYSNIVSNSIVGSKYTNLLKVVPIPSDKKFGEQIDIDFNFIEYQPLNTNILRNIEISLYDDSGEVIPFKFGRTIVKLHFKKDESIRDILS